MQKNAILNSPKLEKGAKRILSQYYKEFAQYEDFLEDITFDNLREDILTHFSEKIAGSTSEMITKAEATEILTSLGTVDDLVKDFNVPKLIRIPFFGSSVGIKQLLLKKVQLLLFIAILLVIDRAIRTLLWDWMPYVALAFEHKYLFLFGKISQFGLIAFILYLLQPKKYALPIVGTFLAICAITPLAYYVTGQLDYNAYLRYEVSNTEQEVAETPKAPRRDTIQQWSVNKEMKQKLEIIVDSESIGQAYVYYGKNLKDNEVRFQVKYSSVNAENNEEPFPDYVYETNYEKDKITVLVTETGAHFAQLKSNLENQRVKDEHDITGEWGDSTIPYTYGELIIFVPEQFNVKASIRRLETVPNWGWDTNTTRAVADMDVYFAKGIISYLQPDKGKYDDNTGFSYFETVKSSPFVGIQIETLGKRTLPK